MSPEVNSVAILGDFNDWDSSKATTMKASLKEFSAVLDLNVGKSYEFRYLINNNSWDNDFSADKYVASPFVGITNSVIVLEGKTIVASTSVTKAPTKAAPKAKTVKSAVKDTKPTVAKASTSAKVVAKAKEEKPAAKVTKPTIAKSPAATKAEAKPVVKAPTTKATVAKKASPIVKK